MKVIGFGDNVVDRYVNKKVMFPGGNAVNFAVYAKKSGVNAAYLGNLADDAEADFIVSALNSFDIDLTGCHKVFGSVTERCDVNIVDGDRVFIGDDVRENIPAGFILSQKDVTYLNSFDLVHSGCYARVADEIKKLSDISSIVTYDFSVEDEFKEDKYLKKICPYIDMALFSCEGMSTEEIIQLQKKVYTLGTKYVLTTKGVEGQTLYDGINFYTGVVKLVEAVDTMGAGDSFFASFVMALLKQGWKKNGVLSEEMIKNAFETAAQFSADNCLTEGAFGYSMGI
ncbi:MAG: PfkB family carbohydrate kinase [Herbinix sp.]|nr:PfkB family carbohydrate kinase [Herbinix sp.]